MSLATSSCVNENSLTLSNIQNNARSVGIVKIPPGIINRKKPITEKGDLYWIEVTLAGDSRGFDMLVKKYQERIHRLVQSLIKDSDLSNDIVQETFIRAFKALKNYRRESKFYTWLYRIAMNTSYNYLKSNKIYHTRVDSLDDELVEISDTHHLSPERSLENDDLRNEINRAVAKLPIDLRSSLILRDVEGFSYDQISEILGCEIGTVKSRISRARTRVAEKTVHLYART